MDQELIAYLGERFRDVNQRMDSRFEQMDSRFEGLELRIGRVEDSIREARVEIEAVRGDVRQVAEGVAGCNERIESFRAEFHTAYSQLSRRVTALEAWRETVDPGSPLSRKRRP
jgi:chromosome segregation ATPase